MESVERAKCGWDLACTSPAGEIARVEVKGASGPRPVILMTRNEYRSSMEEDGWVLAVVTRAVTAPKVTTYDAATARNAAEPYVYQLDMEGTR